MLIDKATNSAIIAHIEKMAKYIDSDLLHEYKAGINFLYDFGFLSLYQWNEMQSKFDT